MALTTEQCELLAAVLEQAESDPPTRTTEWLATRVDLSPRQVAARLEELQSRSPPLVRRVYEEDWQVNAWRPTEHGHAAHDRWCAG